MTFISDELKVHWTTRARRGAMMKLKTLLEFRTLLDDAKAEGYPPLMALYAEAAEAMMCAAETLRREMITIREYPEMKLVYWLASGASFDHIDTANSLAETAHKTPAQLLDEAVSPGNATGETMTVKELTAFALGERPMPPVNFAVNRTFNILRNFPTRLMWDDEKTARFNILLDALKEFFV